MPEGTPWGQTQLRIFDRKFLQALKITNLNIHAAAFGLLT
jgi:hypothetical protein